jgi:hypothetical protein
MAVVSFSSHAPPGASPRARRAPRTTPRPRAVACSASPTKSWQAASARDRSAALSNLCAASAAIHPNARALVTLRAMLNERTLQPSVVEQ